MAKRPRIQGKKIASTDGLYPALLSALQTSHITTLEAYLQDAVDSEQYEFAAKIRDRITEVKNIKPITGPDIETVDVPY